MTFNQILDRLALLEATQNTLTQEGLDMVELIRTIRGLVEILAQEYNP